MVNKSLKCFFAMLLVFFIFSAFPAGGRINYYANDMTALAGPGPQDTPRSPGDTGAQRRTLHRVTAVILVIWIGIGLYLYRIDRRVARLEKKIDER
jgi:CcmD family protein